MSKYYTLIVLMAISSATYAQTMYPGNIPGCVARYKFSPGSGNILNDASGNNNNGVMTNMTPTTGWRGQPNTAMKFDGTSSYALVPNSATLNPQQITIVALFRMDTFYTGPCQVSQIIAKGSGSNAASGQYALGISDNYLDGSCATYSPAMQTQEAGFGTASPFGPPPGLVPMQTRKWYFSTIGVDGQTAEAYQAVMDSSNHLSAISGMWTRPSSSNSIGMNTDPLTIGRLMSTTYPYWFNGEMDELVIFNRKLTNAEIYSIYDYLYQQPLAIHTETPAAEIVKTGVIHGQLHIETANNEEIGEIAIYDMLGHLLMNANVNASSTDLSIGDLPQQMLVLQVRHKGITHAVRVANF